MEVLIDFIVSLSLLEVIFMSLFLCRYFHEVTECPEFFLFIVTPSVILHQNMKNISSLKDIHLLFNFSFFHFSGSYEAIQKVRIHEALLHLTGGSIQQVNLTQDTKLSEKGRDKLISDVN